MTKAEFLILLGKAYNFPDYYAANLDSAEELLADRLEESGREALSLKPLLEALLAEASADERAGILDLLETYFEV